MELSPLNYNGQADVQYNSDVTKFNRLWSIEDIITNVITHSYVYETK